MLNLLEWDLTCHVCGSLFDTEAPPCPQFDRNDPAQTKTCDAGEACLYYKWQKADDDFGESNTEKNQKCRYSLIIMSYL